MRSAIIALLLVSAAFAASSNMEQLFDAWKAKYGVSYPTEAEDEQRFHTFCQNYQFITQYNENHSNSKLALNKFSDLTSSEFRALYTGLNKDQFSKTSSDTSFSTVVFFDKPPTEEEFQEEGEEEQEEAQEEAEEEAEEEQEEEAPSSNNEGGSSAANFLGATHSVATSDGNTEGFNQAGYAKAWNWETQGVLNPVQNQGQCGGCWAFSTTAAMEALYKINGGRLLKFSEQQLIDCDTRDFGCNGGVPDYAMAYVAQNGMMLESAYPYQGEKETCQYNQEEATMGINTGSTDVPKGNVEALKSAIFQQPTVIEVDAADVLQSYSSGVLDASSGCAASIDHAVLAVGYGNFEGQDAFVVRNSWGTDWGVNGYFYVSSNNDNNGMGTCGILANPVAPTGRRTPNRA